MKACELIGSVKNKCHAPWLSSLAFSHHSLSCAIYNIDCTIRTWWTPLFFISCLASSSPFFFLLPPPLEYLTELREYGTVYSSWAGSEEELRRPLEGVAGCVATCCRALEDQSENMSQDFLPVLREYILYIESMKVRRTFWEIGTVKYVVN